MYDKTDFYRLSQSHYTFNNYIESLIRQWYKDKYGKRQDFLYEDDGVIWKELHREKVISVKFSNGEECKIPVDYFHAKKDYDGNPYPDIETLWHDDYYDGYLSGVALYNGEKVWYQYEDEDKVTQIRSFGIYEILPEQLVELEHWHKLFQEMVGYHTDHGAVYKDYKLNPTTNKYYEMSEEAERDIDCTKNKCLGIFDECHLR